MEKIWNSPETSSVNRLPMLNVEHPTSVSLDGTWNFQLLANPSAPLSNWQKIPKQKALSGLMSYYGKFIHCHEEEIQLLKERIEALEGDKKYLTTQRKKCKK